MDLSKLNDRQKEAVLKTEGALLVLAGAGSGKTSTMTHRIAYLIEELGVSPYSILAVTFTNKAANEMKSRVESLCGATYGMWIMTFHAMCLRILRRHAHIIGFESNFIIYDTTDQKTVIKNILKADNIDTKDFPVQYLLSIISDKKEKGITASMFSKSVESDNKQKTLAYVYEKYEKALKANNAMDFDDLLLNTLILFKKDKEVVNLYMEKFNYVMVDEYQDTNRIQYELIIRHIASGSGNICVVGDDDQCIYEWRGADIRNILDFERDFQDATVIKLEQNYRSVSNIIDAAHSVVENNKGRKRKKLWTSREKGSKVLYCRTDNEKEEAEFISKEIELLKDSDSELKYSDFAVLYRMNAQSRSFEASFARHGLPYRVLSGMRYYDRKEIKDMMAYMRLVINPKDALSLKRIINEPKRGLGAKTLDKLVAVAEVRRESLFEALKSEEVISVLSTKTKNAISSLIDVISTCSSEIENMRISDIYDILLTKTGYLKKLEDEMTLRKSVEAESRLENLMEFKTVIGDYEKETDEPTIADFMEGLTLMAEIDNHDADEDAIVLMTMHSAKGLEFPVVFMPGMEDGIFPGRRSFDSLEDMEEERRLCYVGMTRAKERLIMTGAAVRTLYGRTDYTRESQFLKEINKKYLEGDSVFERKKTLAGGINISAGPGVSTGSFDGYYDPMKYAREETKKKAKAYGGNLGTGDKVKHAKFGTGLIVGEDTSTLTVAFDSVGIKKMAKGIAPLKKI